MDGSGLPFFLRVSHVIHTHDHSDSSDLPLGVWLPPRRKSCYSKRDLTGWYVWDPGLMYNYSVMSHLRRPNQGEQQRLRPYRAATMFWDPYAHNYLHVPLDCTVTDIDDTESEFVWRRPGFSVCQAPGSHDIAVIGHSEEHKQLPLPGPSTWFEKLLPITLQPPSPLPGEPQSSVGGGYCKLAGDLDILIGLIAFSTTFEHIPTAINRLFRPDLRTAMFSPAWSNGLPTDDARRCKGLLVEIGYDPGKIPDESLLRDWERGLFGEMFR